MNATRPPRLIAFLACAFLAYPAQADQAGIGDFGPGALVEDFESLADQSGTLFGPLNLNGNIFTTSSNAIRIFPPTVADTSQVCLGGPAEGHAPNPGTCIGTGLEDDETMSIVLETPAVRAGLWVGLTERISEPQFWSRAEVSFFDSSDNLLGQVEVYGHTFGFAGWDVGAASNQPIARILVADIAANNRVVVIDDLIWQPIPEPTTLAGLAIGFTCLGLSHRRFA